jgi:hypothetical protein
MGKNLMRTAKYASSKDSASSAFIGASVCPMVDSLLTVASLHAHRVLRPCPMVPSFIFKIRRVRTVGAFKQAAAALFLALADGPH